MLKTALIQPAPISRNAVEPAEVAEDRRLGCMEIWGGNRPTASGLSMPGLDVWVWSRREGSVTSGGGDLHYLSSCASGRVTRMLLADICACGPVYPELADELRDLMMRNVNAVQQTRFVRDMNQRLRSYSDRGGYATVMLSTYFAPTQSLTLCNAGNPPPLLYRDAQRTWSVLKHTPVAHSTGESIPPGVVGPREYQHANARLEQGDMVFTYSNELTECRDRYGKLLGIDGILQRLSRTDGRRPEQLIKALVSDIKQEHNGNLADDDATALLCRATNTSVGWMNNLLAPFRLFGRVTNSTSLDA